MKLHQEDPRLTAYALGELPPEESATVERAIADNPALGASIVETEEIRQELTHSLYVEKERLQPHQREAIRRAAREKTRLSKSDNTVFHNFARRTWIASIATAAAVIIGGIFLITLIPKQNGASTEFVERGGFNDRHAGREIAIRMPLKDSGKSLAQVKEAIRTQRRIPAMAEVRIPEMLNAFSLNATESVALWEGCELGVEIMPSPWKPSGSLVFVEILGAKDGTRDLSLEYRSEEGTAIAHRVIGYSAAPSEAEMETISGMGANSRKTLVIEAESSDLRLGSLHWAVNGKAAPPLQLVRDPGREPSDDARFASLVCAYGLKLRGEGGGMIDDALVLRLAREVSSHSLVADRYDFVSLIEETAKLLEK